MSLQKKYCAFCEQVNDLTAIGKRQVKALWVKD